MFLQHRFKFGGKRNITGNRKRKKKSLYKIKKKFESVNQEQKAIKKNKNKSKVKQDIWKITNNTIIEQKKSFVEVVLQKSPDSITQ